MMQFQLRREGYDFSDKHTTVWHYVGDEAEHCSRAEPVEAVFEKKRRLLVPEVASMLITYTVRARQHDELSHNCMMFAKSYLDDDPYLDWDINPEGGLGWKWNVTELRVPPSRTKPGSVLYMNDGGLYDQPRNYHFMVRADMDEGGEALFASKLGSFGPTVLTTLPQITRLYPYQAVGDVGAIVCENP